MESAQLLINGLETSIVPEKERNERVVYFCELVDFFHKTNVSLVKEVGMDAHTFSFGTILDFVYGSWNDFVTKDSLKGIQQTSHQMIASLLMQHPALGAEITKDEWEERENPKTNYGLCASIMESEYVADSLSWQKMRAKYYATHQTVYVWNDKDDSFLPNRIFSDKILEREIKKHGYMEEYQKKKSEQPSDALSIIFHEKVMKSKGTTIVAYTEEIGQEICEANYYKYEAELSKKEHARVKSLRKIYSIINRKGKKQYISLDFKHGMLEFHNEHGDHLGEFRFTGILNSAPESSHNLRAL